MLYEQNNKHRLDEYILSNVKCLYGKHRHNAYIVSTGAMHYTLSQVQCLYMKHNRLCIKYLLHHNYRRYLMKGTNGIKSGNAAVDGKVLYANRRYKDTIFRMLFSDRKNLLELYNAVSGKNYDNADDLQIVTLENAVYMGMKNDLAFLLNTGIYLYEHQSTVNPNMPLRDLLYITAEYSRLVETQSLYSSAIQKVPAPNFIVFYNGQDEFADKSEYRLSEAFEPRVDNPALELRVTVLNINYGRNAELMKQSHTLREYAQYVALVRRYKTELGSLDEAVNRAVDECIRNGVLADFLKRNRAEVVMMSIFEYNQEEEERKLRAAERQAGYASGVEHGIRQGIERGMAQGIERGMAQGMERGMEQGIERGTAENLCKLVNNFMYRRKVTLEEACDALGISADDYNKAERLLNGHDFS